MAMEGKQRVLDRLETLLGAGQYSPWQGLRLALQTQFSESSSGELVFSMICGLDEKQQFQVTFYPVLIQ